MTIAGLMLENQTFGVTTEVSSLLRLMPFALTRPKESSDSAFGDTDVDGLIGLAFEVGDTIMYPRIRMGTC